ncbi:MAG: hypothetical protein JKY12_02835, partial [Sneathiella sp.]|nr:hypothetical protein [Sneathiella sp.]
MSVGDDKKRPSRRYRWIVALFLIGFASLFNFRLLLLEVIGEKVLQSIGFEEANLHVTEVGLTEIQISQIVLDDKLIVENLSTGYSFQSLIRGTVDWISLSGLVVDASASDTGALATVISLVKNQKNTENDFVTGPSIKLANGSIFGNYPSGNFKSKITLSFSPGGDVQGEASFEGAISSDAGQIIAEGVVLSFEAATHTETAKIDLQSGVLRHGVSEPQWSPVTLSGNSSFKDGIVKFLFGAGLGAEIPLVRVEGHYSPKLDIGDLVLDIQDVAFSREGLQPSDLSRHLSAIPKLDAIFSDHSQIKWNKGKIVSESEISLQEVSFEHESISYDVSKTKLKLNAVYNLKTSEQRGKLVIYDMLATLSMNNNKYELNDVEAELNVDNLGEVLKLENVSASFSHLSDEPNFRPLYVQARGEKIDGDFVFEGEVTDIDKRMKLPFNGRYKGADKSAFIRGKLHHDKFERGGFQPKHFSNYFDGLENEITGSSVLAGILAWQPEQGLSIPFLSVNLTEFGYAGKNVQVEDAHLQAKAQNVKLGHPLKLVLSNGAATVQMDDRKATLRGAMAEVLLAEDWQSAEITLSKTKLKPGPGFLIKPEVEVSGSSRVTKKSLSFKGQVKTDLLGSFLEWEGLHDFGLNTGSASLRFSEFEFEEGGLQPSDIIGKIDGSFVFKGGFVPELDFEWTTAGLKSSGKLAFRGLGVKTDEFDLVGITGEVIADQLQPLV